MPPNVDPQGSKRFPGLCFRVSLDEPQLGVYKMGQTARRRQPTLKKKGLPSSRFYGGSR